MLTRQLANRAEVKKTRLSLLKHRLIGIFEAL